LILSASSFPTLSFHATNAALSSSLFVAESMVVTEGKLDPSKE